MSFEIEQPVDTGPSPVVEPTKPRLLGILGPGLITGASDWRHRHRPVVRPRPRWLGGIRCRRSAKMADRVGPPADGSQAFYAVICIATIVGMLMNFTPIDPIRALYWSAVINGVVAVPVMAIMMWLAASPKVMGDFVVTGWVKSFGWVATAVMAVAVAAMLATS
jgi:hypothetical protein